MKTVIHNGTEFEQTLVDIEDIINDPYFGIVNNTEYYPDSFDCIMCGGAIPVDFSATPEIQNEIVENLPHFNFCKIYKLRSLVNTLGDMIA